MYTISREYSFCAAHRLEGHPKCGRLHGHNYRVEIEVEAESLSTPGMVIDFQDLDKLVAPWIEQHDHRYLVSVSNRENTDTYWLNAYPGDFIEMAVMNTTAENIAADIAHWTDGTLREAHFMSVYVREVRVWETPKSCATYKRPWVK